jgi:hypothetical protein
MSGMFSLPKKAINPFPTDYELMEDGTPELDAEHASYYQQLIDIIRWMVEIGRIGIDTQVSMLASHVALPGQGHISAALHIQLASGMEYSLPQKHSRPLVIIGVACNGVAD